MSRRVKFHEHGLHDDIKYKGVFSFQSFQVLGWICITVAVVMALMKVAVRVNPEDAQRFLGIADVISYIAEMSLPFLLMANFARILNNSEGYKKQLLRNGGAAAGIALVFLIFFNRYIVGTVGLLLEDASDANNLVMTSFYGVNKRGFFAFNIFIDLLLCTLFMYFMNARPKRVFTGKKILIFRAFAILPVAYEVVSLLLKGLSAAGQVRIPSWGFPLLSVKPPMTFIVFMMLAIYIKTREWRYCRHGKTHEEYQEFLKTNRNAWNFSVFTAVILFVAGVIDLIIFIVMVLNQGGSAEGVNALVESETAIKNTVAYSVGFGKSLILMIFAPIVLLFNYTKIPKNKTVGMLIPVAGIALIALIVVQGAYQLISIAPIKKLDGKSLTEALNYIFGLLSGQ
ncbi:MAG: hypothetical protein IJQ71_01360 [Clostridia bacterium]|nr:hypothetical protein [Clostridia bacterium]